MASQSQGNAYMIAQGWIVLGVHSASFCSWHAAIATGPLQCAAEEWEWNVQL